MITFASLKTAAALPEICLAAATCAILLVGVYRRQRNDERGDQRANAPGHALGIAALLLTALLLIATFGADTTRAFNNLFINDPMSRLLKIAVCLLSAGAFAYGRRYNQDRGIFTNEYYVLGLFAVVGMMVMISANHLLTLYLGLELMSLCLYAMIAYYRDDRLAAEAAMKYFILGALASSMLLYGMSLLYGLSGSLELSAIAAAVGAERDSPAVALAVVFVVAAAAFKLGAVPFHMWVPDVYHGAPTSTTAFIGAAPKVAAFALMMRLLVGGLDDLFGMWQQMLLLLAILSVACGNIIAIAQSNLKRMLAYSSISHIGFFLFAMAAGGAGGYSAALFYVLIYAVMSLGAFGAILCLAERAHESDRLEDLKGLSARRPWSALALLILMLSMAGIPPTAGFFAKLAVIQSLIDAGLAWAAVIAVLLAVIGAFYYLRVIKLMYFDSPDDDAAQDDRATQDDAVAARGWVAALDARLLLSLNALAIIAILPWINGLIALCGEVIRRFAV
ncbi:MAG: NADH-quinone oxidoreductase subunit NuoN [bacterium]